MTSASYISPARSLPPPPPMEAFHAHPKNGRQKKGVDRRNGLWATEVVLGVAGMKTILSPKTSAFRKCLWGTTLVMCLVVLVAVVGDRIAYFFSYPVNVDVQVIHNDSLKFPAVTVCPAPKDMVQRVSLNPRAVREVFGNLTEGRVQYPGFQKAQKFLEHKLDAKELWDRTSWNISAMVNECFQGRGRACSKTGEFRHIYTMFGPCLTYRGIPATLAGSYHGLYLRLEHEPWEEDKEGEEKTGGTTPKPQGWWLVVHEAEDDPSLLIKTHGYFVGFSWNKEITVSLKQFSSLNTKRKRCLDDPEYRQNTCLSDCFAKAFTKPVRCRLPFMRRDVPYCRGQRVLQMAGQVLDSMLIEGEWQPQKCHCQSPCQHTIYQYRGDTTENREDEMARIKVFFLDLVYEEVVEEFSYPFPSLVADFGGMGGLLLGASILTVLELIECVVVWLARLYARHTGVGPNSYIPQDPSDEPSTIHEVKLDTQPQCNIQNGSHHIYNVQSDLLSLYNDLND